MRTSSMRCFDAWTERALLSLDLARERGKKIIGVYCAYVPEELIRAAGAVPVGLCGKSEAPIPAAEERLPAVLCPLVKSSFGHAVLGTCPFFAASDAVIGETTCDGKKKMFELLAELKPFHLLYLPYDRDGEKSRAYFRSEVERALRFIESVTGASVTEEALRAEVAAANEVRRLLQSIVYKNAGRGYALSGMDTLLVMEARGFCTDLGEYAAALRDLDAELDAARAAGGGKGADGRPRVLFTGSPVGRGTDKVVRIIEESGGLVVCQEHCNGIRSFDILTDEQAEPLGALSHRYLHTPCSCMTPNPGRLSLLSRLIREFSADCVVDQIWQACHGYNIEAHAVKKLCREVHGIPFLHLETTYSPSDAGSLRIRIEGLLEMAGRSV